MNLAQSQFVRTSRAKIEQNSDKRKMLSVDCSSFFKWYHHLSHLLFTIQRQLDCKRAACTQLYTVEKIVIPRPRPLDLPTYLRFHFHWNFPPLKVCITALYKCVYYYYYYYCHHISIQQCQQLQAPDRQTDGRTPRLVLWSPSYGGSGHDNSCSPFICT